MKKIILSAITNFLPKIVEEIKSIILWKSAAIIDANVPNLFWSGKNVNKFQGNIKEDMQHFIFMSKRLVNILEVTNSMKWLFGKGTYAYY